MDTLRAARHPFLRDAREFAEKNSEGVEMLLTSDSYADARERGLQRVLGAIDSHTIPEGRPLIGQGQDYNRLMEVLSYPYARMLVSVVDRRRLTKRYTLAEAEHMNSLLHEDPEASRMVTEELGVRAESNPDGTFDMHFAEFLRYAGEEKMVEWKLINTDVRHGYVRLDADRYTRLLQNAYRIRIEGELPLDIPGDLAAHMRGDVDRMVRSFDDYARRTSPTGGQEVRDEYFPPCIRAIIAQAQAGQNLPHSARFALVSFLHALGMDYEQIVAVFAESPDFDESMSRYQIMHITGELNGTEGYTPPECGTMRTNGICFDPDGLCGSVHHPLNYYRIKSGNVRRKGRSPLPLRLAEAPPGDERPLHRGRIADDGEVDQHDLHEAEGLPPDLEGVPPRERHRELQYGDEEAEHYAVRPAEQAVVQPLRPHRLGLGAHVRGQKHPDDGEEADPRVPAPPAHGDGGDHEHVGVAVEDVVEVVPLGRGPAGELGDFPIEGVEVARDEDEGRAEDEHPVVIPAGVEDDAAEEGGDQTEPRDVVRVHPDKPPRDGLEGEIGLPPVLV